MADAQSSVKGDTINEIYASLGGMEVELDYDPLAFGPKRLNSKVAETRGLLTQCEAIFLRISKDLHMLKREHRRTNTILTLKKTDLLANDPEVRAGRNLTDREAIATTKLIDEINGANSLELSIQDLESLMVVVKAKRSDLKDVQGRLRDQLKICQEEISLGGFWGSRPAPDSKFELEAGQGRATSADVAGIGDLIGEVDGAIHLAKQQGSWEDPEEDIADLDEVLPDTNTADTVDSFLDSADEKEDTKKGSVSDYDFDLDSILDSFEEE